jgi:hypothetical protein
MTDNRNRVPRTEPTAEGGGIGDLLGIRRELFVSALEVARADHDPAREWEAFAEAAWREAALAFGFAEREDLPESTEGAG